MANFDTVPMLRFNSLMLDLSQNFEPFSTKRNPHRVNTPALQS